MKRRLPHFLGFSKILEGSETKDRWLQIGGTRVLQKKRARGKKKKCSIYRGGKGKAQRQRKGSFRIFKKDALGMTWSAKREGGTVLSWMGKKKENLSSGDAVIGSMRTTLPTFRQAWEKGRKSS